jgi:hypothetical protein
MPKQIATVTLEGARKRRRPRKRWGAKVEEELNIMGIKTGRQWPETVRGGRKFYAQPRSTTKCRA